MVSILGLSIKVLASEPGAVLNVNTTLLFGLDAHSMNNSLENPLFKSAVLANTTWKYEQFINLIVVRLSDWLTICDLVTQKPKPQVRNFQEMYKGCFNLVPYRMFRKGFMVANIEKRSKKNIQNNSSLYY